MNIDFPSSDDTHMLRRLWKEAFGDDDSFLDKFFHTAFSEKRTRCIKSDGQIIAALYWFDCMYNKHKIAYVYAVATAKKFQGRGCCTILMNDTHKLLNKIGYDGIILVPASEKLFSFYEKLGYITCAYKSRISADSSNECEKVSRISSDEYAKIRKSYLPPNAILQENENIRFLSTMCSFYLGENFIFALADGQQKFRAVEYLGDIKKLSGILSSFGHKSGEFMIAGKDIPFAMFHSLDNFDDEIPDYLGFAFD